MEPCRRAPLISKRKVINQMIEHLNMVSLHIGTVQVGVWMNFILSNNYFV